MGKTDMGLQESLRRYKEAKDAAAAEKVAADQKLQATKNRFNRDYTPVFRDIITPASINIYHQFQENEVPSYQELAGFHDPHANFPGSPVTYFYVNVPAGTVRIDFAADRSKSNFRVAVTTYNPQRRQLHYNSMVLETEEVTEEALDKAVDHLIQPLLFPDAVA